MYNETIKAENKIISVEDLIEIFQLMGETLKKYQKIYSLEEQQNRGRDYSYQTYTFKDEGSKMRVVIDFYDNTNITFDNYDNFMSILYSRLEEIKSLDVRYVLSYTTMTPLPNKTRNYYTQSIQMYINENKIDISLNLKSEDLKLKDIYDLIKNKILNAPEKYDDVIRKKNKIINTVGLAIGLIPGIVITTILLFIPKLNLVFLKGYVTYPLCILLLAYVIGGMISSSKLDKYYETIEPSKKSAGFDSNYKRVYVDDIDSFVGTSEILIGKKVNNLDNRRIIREEYEKSKVLLPKILIILGIVSIVVIIIGLFI